jgi:hypothetical protein
MQAKGIKQLLAVGRWQNQLENQPRIYTDIKIKSFDP